MLVNVLMMSAAERLLSMWLQKRPTCMQMPPDSIVPTRASVVNVATNLYIEVVPGFITCLVQHG